MNTPLAMTLLAALALSASGCYLREPTPASGVVVVDADVDHEPLYYQVQYIVDYGDDGRPYYDDHDRVQHIPQTDVHFHIYVDHYLTHKSTIHKWKATAHQKKIYKRDQWEAEKKKKPQKHHSPKHH